MIKQINSNDFIDAFHSYNRYDQFGYEALNALYDYLEECDPSMELDVIAICCDYSVDSWQDIASNYSIDVDNMDEDDAIEAVREFLENETTIVAELKTPGMFVYCSAF
jgi:hypothetical protein